MHKKKIQFIERNHKGKNSLQLWDLRKEKDDD